MARLYLIPTPIGNLEDITLRAIRILKEVDLVLCEDTRTTSFLLKHHGIENHLMSHHKFNEHKSVEKIRERIESGQSIALVSDAGTPGISDPGFLLVRTCVEAGITVETLPGAVAFIPALVNSGLPCDRFIFEGFLPQKKGRQKRLAELINEQRTIVLYESPYRVLKTLKQLSEVLGDYRQASVSKEISKLHEENIRGTLSELVAEFTQRNIKGEYVIIVQGNKS